MHDVEINYFQAAPNQEDDVGFLYEACMRGGEKQTGLLLRNLKERIVFEVVGVDGILILQRILK